MSKGLSQETIHAVCEACRYPKGYATVAEVVKEVETRFKLYLHPRTVREVMQQSRQNRGEFGGFFGYCRPGEYGDDILHTFVPLDENITDQAALDLFGGVVHQQNLIDIHNAGMSWVFEWLADNAPTKNLRRLAERATVVYQVQRDGFAKIIEDLKKSLAA